VLDRCNPFRPGVASAVQGKRSRIGEKYGEIERSEANSRTRRGKRNAVRTPIIMLPTRSWQPGWGNRLLSCFLNCCGYTRHVQPHNRVKSTGEV